LLSNLIKHARRLFMQRLAIEWIGLTAIISCLLVGRAAFGQLPTPPDKQGVRVVMARDLSFGVAPPWRLVGTRREWVNELEISDAQALLVARAVINRENQLKHDRALQRLLVTAGPHNRGGEFFLIEGWPAFRRVQTERLPTTRDVPSEAFSRHHVLAIAMDSIFITVDVQDYSSQSSAERAVSEFLDSIRLPKAKDPAASERDLAKLRDVRLKPWSEVNPLKLLTVDEKFRVPLNRGLSTPVLAVQGWGEVELSASSTGRYLAVGTNNGYAKSTDFGKTLTAGLGTTPFPTIPTTLGDPSVAHGVTGRFYLSYIGEPTGSGTDANSFNGCTLPIAASTDAGNTWSFHGNARACAATITITSNCFADQEHIAADDRNPGTRWEPVGQVGAPIVVKKDDQVYAVWREFSSISTPGSPTTCDGIRSASTGTARVARASCSQNGGRSWTVSPPPVTTAPNFDFSKITVGRDGSVYTVSALDRGDGWTELWLASSARAWMVLTGYPDTRMC
jgi:hypothetical protein